MKKSIFLFLLISSQSLAAIDWTLVQKELKEVNRLSYLQCKSEPIGYGAYGIVLNCIDQGKEIALKITNIFENLEFQSVSKTIHFIKGNAREKFILETSRGAPHLVSSLWTVVTTRHYYHAMDLQKEHLYTRIKRAMKEGSDSDLQYYRDRYIMDLISALQEFHSMGAIHRDIKTSNILVGNDNSLKLGDFGTSRNWKSPATDGSLSPATERTTPWYLPPEAIFGNSRYGKDIDYWSMGCVIGEIIAGRPLFPSKNGDLFDLAHLVFSALGTPPEGTIGYPHLSYFINPNPNNLRPASEFIQSISRKELPSWIAEVINSLLRLDPTQRNREKILENFLLSQESQGFIERMKNHAPNPVLYYSSSLLSPQIKAKNKLYFLDRAFKKMEGEHKSPAFHFLSFTIDSVFALDEELTQQNAELALASAYTIADALTDPYDQSFDLNFLLKWLELKADLSQFQILITRHLSLLSNIYPNSKLPFYLLREKRDQLSKAVFEIADFYLELLTFGEPLQLTHQEIVEAVIEIANELKSPVKPLSGLTGTVRLVFLKLKSNFFDLKNINSNFINFYSKRNSKFFQEVSQIFEVCPILVTPPEAPKFPPWFPKRSPRLQNKTDNAT